MKQKLNLTIALAAAVVISSMVLLLLLLKTPIQQSQGNPIKGNVTSAERQAAAEEVGAIYYTEYYYPLMFVDSMDENQKEETFTKLEQEGIHITLGAIMGMDAIDVSEAMAYLSDCDMEKSMVWIYAKTPYEATDLSVKTELSCPE
ncbi:MAG: hypothetical protein LBR25_10410 [Erysipelotrichaceae bacterium]|nr:hypothetical protein [Erysipelotrichaceae bacterium]